MIVIYRTYVVERSLCKIVAMCDICHGLTTCHASTVSAKFAASMQHRRSTFRIPRRLEAMLRRNASIFITLSFICYTSASIRFAAKLLLFLK